MNIIKEQISFRDTAAEELQNAVGSVVSLHGSVHKIRKMSGFAFVLIRTAEKTVQCVYEEDTAEFPLSDLKENACIRLEALVKAEERARDGYELIIKTVQILSVPEEPVPVVINGRRMNASLETRLHYRPVTLRNEEERAIFKVQEGLVKGFRNFFYRNHFTEIHTPKIVSSGAEGGANVFGLEYFGRQAYLAQSPQFYKQMMAGVYERVFEIGPVFRAERHDTNRHLNEYTGVDFEMAYIGHYSELMEMEVGMLKEAISCVEEEYAPYAAAAGAVLPELAGIPAIGFYEAKQIAAKLRNGKVKAEKEKEKEDLEPEEEKLICDYIRRTENSDFVFITGYPSAKRPFYAMDTPVCPQQTESFDLLFRGIEITTGGQRIHSYTAQTEKMKERGMDPADFESFLMMHRYGMPPHGGLGLGLERFTAKLLNRDNVRETCLFPRDINRLTP